MGRIDVRLHWYVLVFASVFVLLAITTLFVALAWFVDQPPPPEAAGQELTVPESTVPAASPPPTVQAPERTEVLPLEPEPAGIPGLSVVDVIGNLEHFRTEGRFVCDGPVTTEGTGSIWACSAPGGKLPAPYELTVLGDGPLNVRWVVATTRGASEERATEFFTYVAGLCLPETNPLNPEAWVEQNVSSGGHVSTEGVELTIYGTNEERTLQVVAGGFRHRLIQPDAIR
jgi:hypothetical protein